MDQSLGMFNECQGPQTLEMGFRSICVGLAIILAVLSQRLSGGGAGESPREKKAAIRLWVS